MEFQRIIEGFQGVHLHSSRIKSIDSLLVKVITKRYENLRNPQSPYYKIDGSNYKDIITDLIGMRLIVNYRGKWEVIHHEIVEAFPYAEDLKLYETGKLVPHSVSAHPLLAEIPKVYNAQGDQVDAFKKKGLETKLRTKGYRSIHYTVSFLNIYIEIQVRTIYDEAWSDCDHNYVYKQDENKSHSAVKEEDAAELAFINEKFVCCLLRSYLFSEPENVPIMNNKKEVVDNFIGTLLYYL